MVLAQTRQGDIEGAARDDVMRFAGIPFAAPTSGARRWRAPESPESWTGVRDATTYGPIAPQQDMMALLLGFEVEPQDESCLYLNVFTPAIDDGRRPVMVWIHGGAYVMGSGSMVGYDGSALARRGDVVVVTINYRLGALGYLHLAELDPAYADSGNLGVLDQVAALTWVRDNIAGFGGDPENVTVFGESAGGMSVGTLLGAPAARGLFHKAIPESGAAHAVSPRAHAAEIAHQFADALGVSSVEELAALPADRIVEVQQDFVTKFFSDGETQMSGDSAMRLPFQPVVDGVVLPEPAIDAVAGGMASDIPVLIGTCRDEWKLFQMMDPQEVDDTVLERRLGKLFDDPASAAAVYRSRFPDDAPVDLFGAAITDLVFAQPAIRLSEALAATGAPTYSYLFTWSSSPLGACHGLEVPFVFGNMDGGLGFLVGDAPPAELTDIVQESWLAFAKTGDPSNEFVGTWPTYDDVRRATMLLDLPPSVVDDPEAARRELWANVL